MCVRAGLRVDRGDLVSAPRGERDVPLKKALATAPLPPGETGTELTGSNLVDVLAAQFKDMTDPARVEFSIKDIQVKRLGRWVVFTITFREYVQLNGEIVNEVKVRMPRARAESLRLHLARVLEARS